MAKLTPTSRTLALLMAEGYTSQVVEQWLTFCKRRRDLFGCIDVLGVRPGHVLGVQCTTRDHQADRLAKALALPSLRVWLEAGSAFEVWGWAKVGARGEAKRWQVSRRAVTLADLPTPATPSPDGDLPTMGGVEHSSTVY